MGPIEESAWAVSGAIVGSAVLGYHLLLVRAGGVVLADAPAPVEAPMGEEASEAKIVETIEITAPAGTGLEAITEAIRGDLPVGTEIRVLPDRTDEH